MLDATDGTTTLRLFSDLRMGVEGHTAHARHTMREGEQRFCALSWTEELGGPRDLRGGRTRTSPNLPLLARVARRRHLSRPSLARVPAALGARAEGADLRADRGDDRGADDVAAGDAGRRAQLGLPLLLDARRDVHAVGAARARPRLGGERLHGVPRRPRAQQGRLAPDHVRDRRRAQPQGDDAAPPQGLRRLAAGAQGQRRLQPAPERRLRRRARLGLPAHQAPRPHPRPALAGALRPGRLRLARLAPARPGDLGGARRAAALRLIEADVLGRARSRRAPGGAARRARPRAPLAGRRRRDPRRHPRPRRRRARRVRPALRARPRSTPRAC